VSCSLFARQRFGYSRDYTQDFIYLVCREVDFVWLLAQMLAFAFS